MTSTEVDSISPEHYEMFQHFSAIFSETAMKEFMLELIVQHVSNVLEMIRSVLYKDTFNKQINAPHKLFVWRYEQLMTRLKSGKPFVDVTKFEDKRNLINCKILIDLDNIEELMQEILLSCQSGQASLKDCEKLLALHKDLTIELQENRQICKHLERKFEKFEENIAQEQLESEMKINAILDNCMDEILVIDPVIQRLKWNTHEEHCLELQEKLNKQQQVVEEKIKDCKKLILSSDYTQKQTAMHHERTIQTLKNKITYWSNMYEATYDHVDNENNNLKLRNKVMEENFTSCKQRLLFIREDTARMAADDMEKLKKAAEEKALAKLKTKVKSPKKKKADKKAK